MSTKSTPAGALITLITIFFFWGFVAASNDILIPVFKDALTLTAGESQMISFCFYVAYTVGSLIYFAASQISKQDILNKIGYRNGLALGLLISAVGTLLFIPAANNASFPLLLGGLFIVGLGFSLQQIAANPLAIAMGDPAKGSQRLSLAGGINNVGTTIGPVIIAFAIFGSPNAGSTTMNLESVKLPYIILGIAFVLAALMFKFSSVPDKIDSADTGAGSDIGTLDSHLTKKETAKSDKKGPFSYPQLYFGMIAIFMYVGVEVSTASNLPDFMKQAVGMPSSGIAPYVSLFWASLMIGRWTSASGAFNVSNSVKQILNLALPFVAFLIFIFVNSIAGHEMKDFYFYAAFIVLLIVVDRLSGGKPSRQLMIYSVFAIASLITGIMASGMVSAWAFILVGLFCSTLWPCIFTLAITGLGRHTNEGSSFLIMMIMGGGVVSLIQGKLAEPHLLGIQNSYWVGVVCFVYLAFYAWKTRNLDTSNTQAAAH
jgi:FHS family L-fucose permease-like MFS transporter